MTTTAQKVKAIYVFAKNEPTEAPKFFKIENPDFDIQPVEIPRLKYLTLFTHKRYFRKLQVANEYSVTEALSGMSIGGGGPTPEAAAESARQAAKPLRKADITKLIDDLRARCGTAPKPEYQEGF